MTEKEVTPMEIVTRLIHLPPEKMADAISAINRGNAFKFDFSEEEGLTVKPVDIYKEPEAATIDLPMSKTNPEDMLGIPTFPEPVKPKSVATSDAPPCNGCGGTQFLRTGTCHVCMTCGASQGCS